MAINKRIPVARLWHKKGKYEYFSMKQLIHAFPNTEFEFHIVLDQYDYKDEWSTKMDKLNTTVTYYSKEFMVEYFKNAYPRLSNLTDKFPKFIHFYHILIGHYLRRVLLKDYMLTYEYDIIFNDDVSLVEPLLHNCISFGVIEPSNVHCDKALLNQLTNIFQTDLIQIIKNNNERLLGINAGFQGINLSLFDEFLSPSNMATLIAIFNFQGIIKEDGTELWGGERMVFDTQEQSFYSIMNQIHSSNFVILPESEYFFLPCWEDADGMVDAAMKSKIVHFTGHKKAKLLYDIIDEKLQHE